MDGVIFVKAHTSGIIVRFSAEDANNLLFLRIFTSIRVSHYKYYAALYFIRSLFTFRVQSISCILYTYIYIMFVIAFLAESECDEFTMRESLKFTTILLNRYVYASICSVIIFNGFFSLIFFSITSLVLF